jgi:hypothetical protein
MDRLEMVRLYKFIEFSEVLAKLRENYMVQLKASNTGEFAIRVYLLRRISQTRAIKEDLTGENGFINRLNKALERCPVKAYVEIEPNPSFNDTVTMYVFPKVPVKK